MGEKICLTMGTPIHPKYIRIPYPSAPQVLFIREAQIKKQFVGFERMRKKGPLTQSLRFEFLSDVLADLITVLPDAWPKGCQQGGRVTAEMFLHTVDNLQDQLLACALPAAMDSGNGPLVPIRYQNGKAVRRFDDKEYALTVGHQSIPGQQLIGNIADKVKDIRMDLAQKHGAEIFQLRMCGKVRSPPMSVAETMDDEGDLVPFGNREKCVRFEFHVRFFITPG